MKVEPKKFTYNEIIEFFMSNGLPLTEKQIALIASKVRIEIDEIEKQKAYRQDKLDKKWLKRKKFEKKRDKNYDFLRGAPEKFLEK